MSSYPIARISATIESLRECIDSMERLCETYTDGIEEIERAADVEFDPLAQLPRLKRKRVVDHFQNHRTEGFTRVNKFCRQTMTDSANSVANLLENEAAGELRALPGAIDAMVCTDFATRHGLKGRARLPLALRFPNTKALNTGVVPGAHVMCHGQHRVVLRVWSEPRGPSTAAYIRMVTTVGYCRIAGERHRNTRTDVLVRLQPVDDGSREKAALQILRRFLLPILEDLRWRPDSRLFRASGFAEEKQAALDALHQ